MTKTVLEENLAMDALRLPLEIDYKNLQPCDQHKRLSNKLGTFFAARLTQLQLEECLRDNFIQVYPLAKVEEFMTAKAAAVPKESEYHRVTWGWHPLRTIDRDRPAGVGPGGLSLIYSKPVPVEVLMTVEKISDLLGTSARFYVADLVRVNLRIDPFLCVTGHACPRYVIERWDEPTFRS